MSSPEAWLRRQAAQRPDTEGLRLASGGISFAALDERVDAIADVLRKTAKGRVLGSVSSQADMLGLLALAAPRAGMALFPTNPKLAPEQIGQLLAQAGTRTAVLDESSAGMGEIGIIPTSALDDPPQARHGSAPSAEAIQLIIATSGSTGRPKGSMLTGANLAAAVNASRHRLPLEPSDVWLGCLPMHHIGGLSVLFRCLQAGATALLHQRFDAAEVGRDLASGQATHVSLVPAMLAQLLDLPCRPSPRLRCVLVGGAGLPAALAERAMAEGWPICPSYGMSEAASQVATCITAAAWNPGMAGEPLPGVEIGTSPMGRIRVRGPSVMAGYVNPALLPGDGLDADGWFETNDLGGLDAQGRVQIRGRADDVLISGGENVHPLQVEDLAGRCPGVQAIGVTGRSDSVWGEILVAVVAGPVLADAFLAWCREHLPSHLRPRAMVAVDALPMTAGGKLDRAALRRYGKNS